MSFSLQLSPRNILYKQICDSNIKLQADIHAGSGSGLSITLHDNSVSQLNCSFETVHNHSKMFCLFSSFRIAREKKGMRGCNDSFQQCDKSNDWRGTTNYGYQQGMNVLESWEMTNSITYLGNNTGQDKRLSSQTYSFQPEAVQV